jgi:MFS family permease
MDTRDLRSEDVRVRRVAVPLLALTVGFVLADSAIVTLALPEILRRLGGTVPQVAWVLIAFNLVLALVVVPAAWVCGHRDPVPLCAAGIAVFAGASAACALAGSMPELIAARCVQALGGAFALVACLELLVATIGERRGIATWIAAGVIGTAVGPVAGGLLTETISWQAIFVVQVPVAVLAVPAALTVRGGAADRGAADRGAARGGAARRRAVQRAEMQRPAVAPNVSLVLLSAALTAALFLLVLLLVEGWRRSPAIAALAVSVVPVAAFVATPLARRARAAPRAEIAAGCLLVAGGLAALAIPPSAHLAWTIAPQALIGLGLGLSLDRLTVDALRDRSPRVMHAGWTISARHAGVVLGLAILTPVFTADLRNAQVPAQEAITALVLDAPLPADAKIALARGLSDQLTKEHGRVPDLHPAFARLELAPADRPAAEQLERNLNAQLERAATQAFHHSFLIAAGLALMALVPMLSLRRRVTT